MEPTVDPTAVPANGHLLDPAPEVVCQRVILADSKIVGQAAAELDPGSKAAYEVERLYGWVRDKLQLKAH